MKRTFLFCFVASVIVSLLVGACSQTPATTVEPSVKTEVALPKMASIGTTPTGTVYYNVGVGLAVTLKKYTPMEVNVQAGPGPAAWLPLMQKGEIEMGLANGMDIWMARQGVEDYAKLGAFETRALQVGNGLVGTCSVRKSSPYRDLRDLKGKRVSFFPTGHAGTTIGIKAQLAFWGMSPNDVIEVPITNITEAAQNLIEGKVEACGTSVGSALMREMDNSIGVRTLPLSNDPEAVKKMQVVGPALYVSLVQPTVGVPEPMYLQTMDCTLVSAPQMSDDLAYTIVKVLWDNYEDLKQISSQLAEWSHERSVSKNITIPYHPGAIKFYKEKGVWTPEMQTLQEKLLAKK